MGDAAASQAPSRPYVDIPEPCVMSAYKACSGRRVYELPEDEILRRLDKIDKDLVACIDLDAVYLRAPACCKHGLGIVRGVVPLDFVLDEVWLARQKRKGEPRPEITGGVAAAVRQLATLEYGRLYALVENPYQHKEGDFFFHCGSFFVEKKPDANGDRPLRTILDARAANARISTVTSLGN